MGMMMRIAAATKEEMLKKDYHLPGEEAKYALIQKRDVGISTSGGRESESQNNLFNNYLGVPDIQRWAG